MRNSSLEYGVQRYFEQSLKEALITHVNFHVRFNWTQRNVNNGDQWLSLSFYNEGEYGDLKVKTIL